MTTLELIEYYVNLLIIQYSSLPNASATVGLNVTSALMTQTQETVTFTPTPTGGTFKFAYDIYQTALINWNDSSATIQTKIQAIPPLANVTVTGSIVNGLLITFNGFSVVPFNLVGVDNLLTPATIITNSDILPTLPLAVQNGYNLLATLPSFPNQTFPLAQGVQLDVLAKYVGVKRTALTSVGDLTLNDTDFLTLIKFAALVNTIGSDLYSIEFALNQFFPNEFILTDYKDMHISYLFSSSIGSRDLFYSAVAQGKIPKPMAVGLGIIYVPDVYSLFGFSTYFQGLNTIVKPFNRYSSFNTNWFFLSYSMRVF